MSAAWRLEKKKRSLYGNLIPLLGVFGFFTHKKEYGFPKNETVLFEILKENSNLFKETFRIFNMWEMFAFLNCNRLNCRI